MTWLRESETPPHSSLPYFLAAPEAPSRGFNWEGLTNWGHPSKATGKESCTHTSLLDIAQASGNIPSVPSAPSAQDQTLSLKNAFPFPWQILQHSVIIHLGPPDSQRGNASKRIRSSHTTISVTYSLEPFREFVETPLGEMKSLLRYSSLQSRGVGIQILLPPFQLELTAENQLPKAQLPSLSYTLHSSSSLDIARL